ncbi:hypothetical protein [Xylanibacter brevis]|jgi:hypothetical protein|uniref:hypothetical protein n=1 Tax=Xylanibacter brevis TaxID=83231 RepID=UPI000482C973|nr:hypothetical protein [Xylanibacter brevis]
MDYKYIEQLLNRYFEAETTLKEEQILKAFFEQDEQELPAELRQYRELFVALEPEETLGDDFDARMLQMTEERVQVKARSISLTERMRPFFRAAAVVAVVITIAGALDQSFKEDNTWVDESDFAQYRVSTSDPAMADLKVDSLASDSLMKQSTGYLE